MEEEERDREDEQPAEGFLEMRRVFLDVEGAQVMGPDAEDVASMRSAGAYTSSEDAHRAEEDEGADTEQDAGGLPSAREPVKLGLVAQLVGHEHLKDGEEGREHEEEGADATAAVEDNAGIRLADVKASRTPASGWLIHITETVLMTSKADNTLAETGKKRKGRGR
eukprot:760256-Hanusia_phi.AAC.3